MYKISKEFHFSASHQLKGLPDTHPCSRPHGHNYVAKFYFRSATLCNIGFVVDYRELDPIKKYIDSALDHRNLNDLNNQNPTAENIARSLFERFSEDFPQLYKVEVSETQKTKACYERD
jgi:6-pyruvoyltetrahydropterin/6-carboxytetrahydropterin synthase